jgi:tRNA/tmRNA/rRNA uracil-C5-methylase (TrmA/RlmC/RlmD family)
MDNYRVKSLRGFDMFPQTAHVETVCELVPAA